MENKVTEVSFASGKQFLGQKLLVRTSHHPKVESIQIDTPNTPPAIHSPAL